ncbi:hypothetical protein FOXB_04131, partial [Fusarium oxysporum f. sp. conglutinans Fo5176]
FKLKSLTYSSAGPNLLPATHFKGLLPTPADTTLKSSTAQQAAFGYKSLKATLA